MIRNIFSIDPETIRDSVPTIHSIEFTIKLDDLYLLRIVRLGSQWEAPWDSSRHASHSPLKSAGMSLIETICPQAALTVVGVYGGISSRV